MERFNLLSISAISAKVIASFKSVSLGLRDIGDKRLGNLPTSFVL